MGHQEGDFTHTLDLLGLTPMEAAVYLSILRRGTAKSSDIISELKNPSTPALQHYTLTHKEGLRQGFW